MRSSCCATGAPIWRPQEKDVNVTFPEEYGSKELAGKPALFKVTVKEIKLKELPALDDEFAKDLGDFSSLADLKEKVHKDLMTAKDNEQRNRMREQILKKLGQ